MAAFYQIILHYLRQTVSSRLLALLLAVLPVLAWVLAAPGLESARLSDDFSIRLQYPLSVISIVAALAVLWNGASIVAEDVQSQRIQMLMLKPQPPFKLWLGMLLGTAAPVILALVLSFAVVHWRLSRSIEQTVEQRLEQTGSWLAGMKLRYPDARTGSQELDQSLQQILELFRLCSGDAALERLRDGGYPPGKVESPAGEIRRFNRELQQIVQLQTFHMRCYRQSEAALPPITPALVEERVNKLIKENPDIPPERIRSDLSSVRLQLRSEILGIAPGAYQEFTFNGIRSGQIHVRMTLYSGHAVNNYAVTDAACALSYYDVKEEKWTQNYNFPIIAGRPFSLSLTEEACEHFIKDGSLRLRVANPAGAAAILRFQPGEAPAILHSPVSWRGTLAEAFVAAVLLCLVCAGLGTSLGLCLSPPMAILMSMSSLALSIGVSLVYDSNDVFVVENAVEQGLRLLHQLIALLTPGRDELRAINAIAEGRSLGLGGFCAQVLLPCLAKLGLLALAGILIIRRAEFGKELRQ